MYVFPKRSNTIDPDIGPVAISPPVATEYAIISVGGRATLRKKP